MRNICLQNIPQSFHTPESWKGTTDMSAALQGLGSGAIFKWDKARTIFSMTHARTQTLCVTHVVTHCCPPALLTQLYTSVMGLGAKTAGRRPSPDQTIGGARCCVWEGWVHGSDSVILQTLTFKSTEHAVVCLSVRVRHDERRPLVTLGYLKILILLLGQGLFRNHEDPQAFPCHVSTLEKASTTSLVRLHDLIILRTICSFWNCQSYKLIKPWNKKKKSKEKKRKKKAPPLPASRCTGQCLPSPRQHPSCRKWSLQWTHPGTHLFTPLIHEKMRQTTFNVGDSLRKDFLSVRHPSRRAQVLFYHLTPTTH